MIPGDRRLKQKDCQGWVIGDIQKQPGQVNETLSQGNLKELEM